MIICKKCGHMNLIPNKQKSISGVEIFATIGLTLITLGLYVVLLLCYKMVQETDKQFNHSIGIAMNGSCERCNTKF